MDISSYLPGIGAGALGLLIGGLVALYVSQTAKFNLAALTGAVSTLAGAGVMAIFKSIEGATASTVQYWWYPIGLFFGAVIMGLIKGKI